jgi:protein-tyrosine-phosphatase
VSAAADGSGIQVMSAGSHPVPQLHPNTVRVLREDYGIDLEPRPRQWLDALQPERARNNGCASHSNCTTSSGMP